VGRGEPLGHKLKVLLLLKVLLAPGHQGAMDQHVHATSSTGRVPSSSDQSVAVPVLAAVQGRCDSGRVSA
jgi:hypothetical protein